MRIGDTLGSAEVNPLVRAYDLEDGALRRKEGSDEEAAMKKVEEAQHSATQSTFKMMDRHNEMVKKSQEIAKEQAKKNALERMKQEDAEEHRELLAEMAIRNAERRDLLEVSRLEK